MARAAVSPANMVGSKLHHALCRCLSLRQSIQEELHERQLVQQRGHASIVWQCTFHIAQPFTSTRAHSHSTLKAAG